MSAYWRPERRSWIGLGLSAWLCLMALPVHAAPVVEVSAPSDTGRQRVVSVTRDRIVLKNKHGGTATIDIEPGPNIRIDHSGDAVVRLFSDAHVGRDERIDGDVVAVFGSVDVDGEVMGSVVSVFGVVRLGPEARVEQDVVSVGGGIDAAPSARILGESTSIGFLPLTLGLPGLSILISMVVLGWLMTLLFGWLFQLLFPAQLSRAAEISVRRSVASFALGLASGPIALIGFFLLCLTVIGVPVAILALFAYPVLVYMGQIVGLHVLGARLTRQSAPAARPLQALIMGSLFVALFFALGPFLWQFGGALRSVAVFLSLLGVVVLLILSLLGTGALLLSRFGNTTAAGPAAAPSPEPAAPTV